MTVGQLASHIHSAALKNMKPNLVNSKEFTHGNRAVVLRDPSSEIKLLFHFQLKETLFY